MLGFLIAWATGNLDKYNGLVKEDYPQMPKVKQPKKDCESDSMQVHFTFTLRPIHQ